MCRRTALFLLALATSSFAQGIGSLERRLNAAGARIDELLATSVSRSIPLIAASAGVTYAFDPLTGTFAREPAIVGQLYLERADPIGRRKFNLNVSYQYVSLASLEGQEASDLQDPLPIRIDSPVVPAVRIQRLDASANLHEFALSATYGLTDDIDANVTLPIIYRNIATTLNADAAAIIDGVPVRVVAPPIVNEDQGASVGDMAVRARWRFLERDTLHAAAGLVLRLPTGDEFVGTDAVEVNPRLYASTRSFQPARWARLQGHLNLGMDFDTDDFGDSEGRWGLGLDWGVTEGLTAAIAVLGRHAVERLAPEGFFDFPRCGPSLAACATDPAGSRLPPSPLFGITGDRPDYYDFSLGGRVNLWRDTVIGFVNVLVPLNDPGVRSKAIPLVGVEATF